MHSGMPLAKRFAATERETSVKILVRATNWVGDAVMAIPALEAIRKRWAHAEIVVLAASWVADLYRGQGYADRLIIYEGQDNGKHRSMLAKEGVAADLRREKFDVAVLLQNAIDAAWIVWRAHIPERIGYAREARGWMLTHPVAVPRPGDTPPHEAYYYLELLRRVGWLAQLPRVEKIDLRVGAEARERGDERLVAAGARRKGVRVAMAAGAAFGSAKCWPPERYAALADRLIAECKADVILFGAPQEREMAARIAEGMSRPALNLAGATRIGELPALLSSCDIFIGNDSGAMHVAGAVGLPVIGIFGPTDAAATGPVTPLFTLVQEPVECSPCFLRHCPIDHRCMTRIEVDRVFAAARAGLQAASVGYAGGARRG